jgi:protein Mpv17
MELPKDGDFDATSCKFTIIAQSFWKCHYSTSLLVTLASTGMAILSACSARLVIKRSLQRQHSLPSAKRRKSHCPEKSNEKSSTILSQVSGKSLSIVRETSPQPFWERLGPLSEAFGAYARTQKRRPWATQIGTSLVVYLCGDLVAQKIDGEIYNPMRTLRHLTIGGICSIPAYSW